MLNILNSEIKKLGTEQGNATKMYNTIFSLKDGLQNTRNQEKYDKMLSQLQETQRKLLLILNDHPNLQKVPKEMQKHIKILERSSSENVPMPQYLQILTLYNFLFIPHTPPKSFITKYGKKPKLGAIPSKNTKKCNPNNTVPSAQTPVQNNSTIPVIITNRSSKKKSSQTCEAVEYNSAKDDFSNMNNVTKETYIPPPQTTVSSHHVRFDEDIDEIEISENYRTSECYDPSETVLTPNDDFSDDFIFNKNIVQYDTVSSLHDFLPIDTASEKCTNITVNVSNKDKVHVTDSLNSNINNSINNEDQNISKCTNITLNVSNKNPTDTVAISKSNKDNSKDDKCQDTNKYTNITVSVSNKDQTHTTTKFQSNVNSPINNKHQNSNKYTNITVSVSGKNQTHTAVSTISDLNNTTDYNLQSNNIDNANNSENNQNVDDDDVVCIKINKKVPNYIEEQQKQNTNKKKKKTKWSNADKETKRPDAQVLTSRAIKTTNNIRSKLIQLNNVIKQNLSLCSSNNIEDWKTLSRSIGSAIQFKIPHINKAAKALKARINKNILSIQDVKMFQGLVNMELQHQNRINNLCKTYASSSNQNNEEKAD